MTMQERGKDEASGPSLDDPRALSSDKAEELAADFTPAWDTGSDDDAPPDDLTAKDVLSEASSRVIASANATLIDLSPPVPEPSPTPAPPIEPKPVILAKNQTLIGSAVAPPTPPPPQAAPISVPQPPPELSKELAAQIALESRAPAEPIPPPRSMKPIAEAKDPFAVSPSRRPRPVSDADLGVPKKSGKGLLLVLLGLGIAGGLGIFLKFALTDDTPKPKEPAQVSSPPVTPPHTDVPPPPPARDQEEPPATAKKAPEPPPPTIVKNDPPPPPPVVKNDPPAVRPNGHHAAPPPPPVVKNDPPPPPPKPTNKPGGIVHENPF